MLTPGPEAITSFPPDKKCPAGPASQVPTHQALKIAAVTPYSTHYDRRKSAPELPDEDAPKRDADEAPKVDVAAPKAGVDEAPNPPNI